MKYGFIGLGNMAGAIIAGMHRSGAFSGDGIYGVNRSPEKTARLAESCGLIPCESAEELVSEAELVVLAVKPQMLPQVMPALTRGAQGKTVLTIAAGKTVQWYKDQLPRGTPVVRVMPNINARVGLAVSAVCKSEDAEERHLAAAEKMFSSVGSVYRVEERLFPAFSALCGASGAFVCLYIDALADAGVKAGFPRSLAVELASKTVLGSAELLLQSGEHPIAVMNSICSPGGTTIEGVMKLKELGFETAVQQATAAIIEKDSRL